MMDERKEKGRHAAERRLEDGIPLDGGSTRDRGAHGRHESERLHGRRASSPAADDPANTAPLLVQPRLVATGRARVAARIAAAGGAVLLATGAAVASSGGKPAERLSSGDPKRPETAQGPVIVPDREKLWPDKPVVGTKPGKKQIIRPKKPVSPPKSAPVVVPKPVQIQPPTQFDVPQSPVQSPVTPPRGEVAPPPPPKPVIPAPVVPAPVPVVPQTPVQKPVAPVKVPITRPAPPPVQVGGKRSAGIAAAAAAQMGITQDCTMLVTNALRTVGINHHGWPASYFSLGHTVTMASAIPGDLLYYTNGNSNGPGPAHIAVYAGNGMAYHGGWNGNQSVLFSAYVGSGPVPIRVH